MLAEYKRYCEPRGQPGVGDQFFRIVLTNYTGKVERIALAMRAHGPFVDFPNDPALGGFDPSDRKFAAAARKSGADVMVCTHSDWLQHANALHRNGIEVDFVCGTDRAAWFVSSRALPSTSLNPDR